MRTHKTYQLKETSDFKEQLLFWAQQYETVMWLDSNNYKQKYSSYDVVLAVDEFTSIKIDYVNAFEKLKEYQSQTNDWIFGYLSYDLKNDTEDLVSLNHDGLDFPELYFFQPQKLFLLKGNELTVAYLRVVDDEIEEDFNMITKTKISEYLEKDSVKISLRVTKDQYIDKIEQTLAHIKRGDIYEANFCQEFYAEKTKINPYQVYKKLNILSQPPFASFFKHEQYCLLSASPERYIKKKANKIISQPIKGTAKRAKLKEEDNKLKNQLQNDPKERSENIMIVDLVRNDMSHTAEKGSVQVEELCEIYTFNQVHQMISTVVSQVNENCHPVDVIKSTFPMGSMTGAPKISAMQIMEELEETKRGLYSGSVGYFTPDNDFDFNVVIRSILYNANKEYISYSVGGAITAKSDPYKEYEECLLKAKAMREALELS